MWDKVCNSERGSGVLGSGLGYRGKELYLYFLDEPNFFGGSKEMRRDPQSGGRLAAPERLDVDREVEPDVRPRLYPSL